MKTLSPCWLFCIGLLSILFVCFTTPALSSGNLVGRTNTFIEDFSSRAHRGADSRVLGWGSGSIALPPAGGNWYDGDFLQMPQAPKPPPAQRPAIIQVTQAVGGNFLQRKGRSTQADDIIALTPTRDCHFHFLKNMGISQDPLGNPQHNGWDVGTDATWGNYIIDGSMNATWCTADPTNITYGREPAAVQLIGGDFNGDGYQDLLYLRAAQRNYDGELTGAHVFINSGSPNTIADIEVPVFTHYNLYATVNQLSQARIRLHWSGDQAMAVDWDDDGRDEVLVATSRPSGTRIVLLTFSSNGQEVVSFQNIIPSVALTGTAVASATYGASQTTNCDGDVQRSRGLTALTVGKFNGDEHWDIVAGSISQSNLYYWPSNPNGTFDNANPKTISFPQGGATVLQTADWDLDGDDDFIVGRSTKGCNGSEPVDGVSYAGAIWMYSNNGSQETAFNEQLRFQQADNPIAELGEDIDYTTTLNLDNDGEDRVDFVLGEGAAWGNYYYYFLNTWLGVYKRRGVAVSTNIAEGDVDASVDLVVDIKLVSAEIEGLSTLEEAAAEVDRATSVIFSVSNNGGKTWSELKADELPPGANGSGPQVHPFTSYGNEILWKAELRGPEDGTQGQAEISLLNDPENKADGLSKTSPKIKRLVFEYTVVQGRNTYSRSGLAQGVRLIDGKPQTFVYSAAFDYPGFRGYLRSFNVEDLEAESSSIINPGDSNPHLESAKTWEAGARSKETGSGQNRVIYSAIAQGAQEAFGINSRRFLTAANVAGDSSALGQLMGTNATDGATVVDFFRSGMGDADQWKLFDVGHSAPAFVGAPIESDTYAAFEDDQYNLFKNQKADREEAIYIGTNGGGVHSFQADDGAENWMWVPSNLLGKLKKQRKVVKDDFGSETIKYEHQFFVDNGVFVQDVYDRSTSSWRTVMVLGQGKGDGAAPNSYSSLANYYSALDITEPDNPIPLWEFGDVVDASRDECRGVGTFVETKRVCEEERACTDSCCEPGHVFIAENDADEIVIDAQNYNGTIGSYHPGVTWEAAICDENVPYALSVNNSPSSSPYDSCAGSPQVNSDGSIVPCGSKISYMFQIDTADTYNMYFKLTGPPGGKIWVSLNDYFVINTPVEVGVGAWSRGPFNLWTGPGPYMLNVWMMTPGVRLDQIVITPNSTLSDSSPEAVCQEQCEPRECSLEVVTETVNSGDVSPECGLDPDNPEATGRQCCEYGDSAEGLVGGNYCRALNSSCADAPPDSAAGETWSKPAFARVKDNGTGRWVVFVGSGYNNIDPPTQFEIVAQHNTGRALYALDALTGERIASWNIDDIPYDAVNNISTIDNTLPGSPAVVDYDNDGYVDRVYIGDLEGRLWRIDTTGDSLASAPKCVLFDAGKENAVSARRWAPIVTRPAIAVFNSGEPNIYFGTGADDRAPNNEPYHFFAVQDSKRDNIQDCVTKYQDELRENKYEWVLRGDDFTCGSESSPNCWGPRYWADPVIVNNSVVYMASLSGHIEDIDPRSNTAGESRVYGRALRRYRTHDGYWVKQGETVFRDANNQKKDYYLLDTKLRQALMVMGQERLPWATNKRPKPQEKNRIFAQAFADTNVGAPGSAPERAPMIEEVGMRASNILKTLRWREVPLGAGCEGDAP